MPYNIEGRIVATGIPGWANWDVLITKRDLRSARSQIRRLREYAQRNHEYRITHHGKVVPPEA